MTSPGSDFDLTGLCCDTRANPNRTHPRPLVLSRCLEHSPEDTAKPPRLADLDPAEVTALAHLDRAEVTRSTAWPTRLDTTTNWAVVTLGIALSVAFAAPKTSPIPLVLVGILIVFFLMLEARRCRYLKVWRARTRWMETRFFAPMRIDANLEPESRATGT